MKALLVLLLLLASLLASSLMLVYCKHQVRVLFAEAERLRGHNWALLLQRERLKLAQSELAALPIIDDKARRQLGMITPHPTEDVVFYQQ